MYAKQPGLSLLTPTERDGAVPDGITGVFRPPRQSTPATPNRSVRNGVCAPRGSATTPLSTNPPQRRQWAILGSNPSGCDPQLCAVPTSCAGGTISSAGPPARRSHRQPVIAGHLNDRRVAHRDPAHMLDRHRLLVIRQRVGGTPIHVAQRAVQPDHHRRHRLVAQRHHHPIPRSRQPRTEQHRAHARNLGPVPVVPLQPLPRLRDPRPRPAPMLLPPPALGLRDRLPGRAIRPLKPNRDQHPVGLIGPDERVRMVNQLRHLPGERLSTITNAGRAARSDSPPPTAHRFPGGDQSRDRLVIATRQRRRATQRPGQVIRLKDLHRFLRFLHSQPSSDRASTATRAEVPAPQDSRGENKWPSMGRTSGHQRGDSVAASGEAFMATDTARRRGSTAPLPSWNGRRASRPRDGALARSWRPHGGWCRFSRRACDRQPWRLRGPELSASSVTDGESCAASPGRLRQAPSVRCARELRPGPMTNALTRVGSGDRVRLFARPFPRRSAAGYGPAVPVAAVQLEVVIADVAANLSRWAMSPRARGGLYLHER
jgi:hypothetical protein